MKEIIFIVGGARSGKSSHALQIAKKIKGKISFLATCIKPDKEMRKRIFRHKLNRPRSWHLVEEGRDISRAVRKIDGKFSAIIIDCLGLWVSNLLIGELEDGAIEKKFRDFAGMLPKMKSSVILVSNDVGAGIIPDNLLSRRFRDLLGSLNQMLAKNADRAIFMQCGIPLELKKGALNAKTG